MDKKRITRYIDKLNHIEEALNDIREWINEALKDKKTKLAVYKTTQEAVEAMCDIGGYVFKG